MAANLPFLMSAPHRIIGQGLAGTCLAWAFHDRGVPFEIVDRENGGSSRVAAGMINPVTGKNFQPSWRIAEFMPEAVDFYQRLEVRLGGVFWHPLPVLRLASSAADWDKIRGKLEDPEVSPWVAGEVPPPDDRWVAAVELKGGGRLDVPGFLQASREFFSALGVYRQAEADPASPEDARGIWCEGATGLIAGRPGQHRCAKGEILTLRADGWDEPHIRVADGGWLIPLGDGIFKAGATYVWDVLDATPTEKGRRQVEEIAHRLAPGPFEVIGHDAGVRPILRRSQPLIGPLGEGWFFNGLGSKGSLYAPGVARRLAEWILDGVEPDPDLDLRRFLASVKH
ncbi:hypothetical protein llg_21400 [Luteolibacter sp. LG18]|nr:hypothetical protein llg_21400 [Luteolibacter sp. LG18]